MSLSNIPIIKDWIKKIDRKIETKGFQSAAMEIIDRTGSKLIIEGKYKNTLSVLKSKPVVIVANHPAEADVLVLLASLENRLDSNLIINSTFTNMLSNLDKHLIPVYINSRIMAQNGIDPVKLRLFKKIHPTKEVLAENEHEENIKSINKAIEKLNQKQLVAIFPGGGGENGKWFSGVGHLIKGVKKPNQAYVVKAYIEGTSNWDGLRFFKFFSKFLPSFKITFSEPSKLNKFQLLNPKETANTLETEFNQWVKTLNSNNIKIGFWNRFMFSPKANFIIRSIFFWLMAKPK